MRFFSKSRTIPPRFFGRGVCWPAHTFSALLLLSNHSGRIHPEPSQPNRSRVFPTELISGSSRPDQSIPAESIPNLPNRTDPFQPDRFRVLPDRANPFRPNRSRALPDRRVSTRIAPELHKPHPIHSENVPERHRATDRHAIHDRSAYRE